MPLLTLIDATPNELNESTLSAYYTDLYRRVSFVAGMGQTVPNTDSDTHALLRDVLDDGYRTFIKAHDWLFLHITTTIATVASDFDITLPDDFGHMDTDELYWPVGNLYPPVCIVGVAQIYNLRQTQSTTGRPRYAAVNPKSSSGTAGQRFELLFWPTPDAAYTLTYRYKPLVNRLDPEAEYPLGGMEHAETIREACLAAYEAYLTDSAGIHTARYQALLMDSIRADSRLAAKTLGYVGDGESGRWSSRHASGESAIDATVTVNGVQY